MSDATDIESAANTALAAHEAKHGTLTEAERLAFQVGFADGANYGLRVCSAIVDTEMLIEKARAA